MVFGLALQTYGEKLSDQQEVLMHVADMLMDVFAADSAVLRATRPPPARRHRVPRSRRTPRASSSTTRPCGSRRRRVRRWPPCSRARR